MLESLNDTKRRTQLSNPTSPVLLERCFLAIYDSLNQSYFNTEYPICHTYMHLLNTT